MDLKEWAKKEVEMACKRENPNWDGKSFDYGCSCYQSALKAFNSLVSDGHSGCSWGITKQILIRLMNSQPLSPITEQDFEGAKPYHDNTIQCPRMSSLFKKIDEDGKITFSDCERVTCIDINNEEYAYYGGSEFVDKLFPITLPYTPSIGKYKIYREDFLVDKNNGDFDTLGYFYMITPDNNRIELNKFRTQVNGKWVDISKKEYDELKKKNIN